MSPIVTLLLGETLLNLYPILVKTAGTSLFNQILIRLVTTCVICAPFVSASFSWTWLLQPKYFLISLLYLLHIYASYYAFIQLNVGVALTLFYLYPIFNIVLNNVLHRTLPDPHLMGALVICLIGVWMIGISSGPNQSQVEINHWWPVWVMIFAAFSESVIFTVIKHDQAIQHNPNDILLVLSFIGAIILIVRSVIDWRQESATLSIRLVMILVLLNVVIGVGGHWLHFYSLSRMTTEWFSTLMFVEVIIGYLLGWLILNERLTVWHLIGTLVIIGGIWLSHATLNHV